MIRQFLATVGVSLLAIGCGTTTPSRPQFDAGTESRLRDGDQITIRLDTGGNLQQAQAYDMAIDENGEIALPLVGHIKATGLTSSELAERIQSSYVPRFYVHCTATVLARERIFYVGGEVRAPSRYPWAEDITLLKAINTAGGFTDFANRGKVDLTRGKDKKTYNCEDLRKHPEKDVPILPGDAIYVPRSIF